MTTVVAEPKKNPWRIPGAEKLLETCVEQDLADLERAYECGIPGTVWHTIAERLNNKDIPVTQAAVTKKFERMHPDELHRLRSLGKARAEKFEQELEEEFGEECVKEEKPVLVQEQAITALEKACGTSGEVKQVLTEEEVKNYVAHDVILPNIPVGLRIDSEKWFWFYTDGNAQIARPASDILHVVPPKTPPFASEREKKHVVPGTNAFFKVGVPSADPRDWKYVFFCFSDPVWAHIVYHRVLAFANAYSVYHCRGTSIDPIKHMDD